MAVAVDKTLCPHDHVCPLIRLCPVGAITQGLDGFPVVDNEVCISCGKCVQKCPMKAMRFVD